MPLKLTRDEMETRVRIVRDMTRLYHGQQTLNPSLWDRLGDQIYYSLVLGKLRGYIIFESRWTHSRTALSRTLKLDDGAPVLDLQ